MPSRPVPSAQERAALEASIRAKVNCEKAAYNMQWELLEPGVTAAQLEAAARVLQPSHYEDIVAERAIDGLCGYPPCTNAAPLKGQGPKFHVSIDDRRVYDISSLHSFCGRECARRSHAYATSLSTTSLFLREAWPQPSRPPLPRVPSMRPPPPPLGRTRQVRCGPRQLEEVHHRRRRRHHHPQPPIPRPPPPPARPHPPPPGPPPPPPTQPRCAPSRAPRPSGPFSSDRACRRPHRLRPRNRGSRWSKDTARAWAVVATP